jgi:hypothetical protein
MSGVLADNSKEERLKPLFFLLDSFPQSTVSRASVDR